MLVTLRGQILIRQSYASEQLDAIVTLRTDKDPAII